MKVTPEQREAIGRLQYTRDGKMLVECIQASMDELNEKVVNNDNIDHVRRFQGSARTLRELISLLMPVS